MHKVELALEEIHELLKALTMLEIESTDKQCRKSKPLWNRLEAKLLDAQR